jgi:magnesium transporter
MEKIFEQRITDYIHRDFAHCYDFQTIQEALDYIRKQDASSRVVYVYAISETGILKGVVPIKKLLHSPAEMKISDIMRKRFFSLSETATFYEAAELFALHRVLALPVLDAEKKILGVVDVELYTDNVTGQTDTAKDTDDDINTDELFQLIGVRMAAIRNKSIFANFKTRFPWLLTNAAGGLIAALITGVFEAVIEKLIVLSLFIPVVLALSESVSIQSMTIAIQQSPDKVSVKELLGSLWKESRVGLLLGGSLAIVTGLIIWAWQQNGFVSASIAVTIMLAMLTSCLIGVVMPNVVRLLKIDPNIASGPIVLATSDIVTLLLYFTIAKKLLL